jgi:hypothetical protein
MTLWYTARHRFTPADGPRWAEYAANARLPQLRELVTLDVRLCPAFFDADEHDNELWQHVVMDGTTMTSFYTDLPYLLSYTYERQRFNLLAATLDPEEPCGRVELDGFEFIGYDVLDETFQFSALTVYSGLDNGLAVREFNPYGLLPNFDDAYRTRDFVVRRARADHGVWAVWRHKTAGRHDVW